MAKSGWGQSKWKCPTCQTWVAERMSMRCAGCWAAMGITRPWGERSAHVEVEDEPVVEVAMEPVVTEAVAAAVVVTAKGGCSLCGRRHMTPAFYRKQIERGVRTLSPAMEAFFAAHEAAS